MKIISNNFSFYSIKIKIKNTQWNRQICTGILFLLYVIVILFNLVKRERKKNYCGGKWRYEMINVGNKERKVNELHGYQGTASWLSN